MTAREWDPILEKEVVDWIEAVTCIERSDSERESVHDWLQSGEVLCALANEIKHKSIVKFNRETGKVQNPSLAAFKRRENISFFLRFCREVCQVAEKDLFGTDDLYDAKDLKQVLSTLFSLGGVIQVTVPDFSGPKLGLPPRLSSVVCAKPKDLPKPQAAMTNFGTSVTKTEVLPVTKVSQPIADVMMPLDLSKESLEKVVVEWIEQVILTTKPKDISASRWLKSGEVLCLLMNTIKPGSIQGVAAAHENSMKVRENISKFIRACREFGVRENDLFTSVDLFEGKNVHACINCIYCLGGVMQAVMPDWHGPFLGKKQQPSNRTTTKAPIVSS